MHLQEISSLYHNVLEFFCVPLHAEVLSDLYTKITSRIHVMIQTYSIKFQLCCNLFLNYDDKRHTHTDQQLKM